jgi:hypothetical protein
MITFETLRSPGLAPLLHLEVGQSLRVVLGNAQAAARALRESMRGYRDQIWIDPSIDARRYELTLERNDGLVFILSPVDELYLRQLGERLIECGAPDVMYIDIERARAFRLGDLDV